MSDLDLRRRMRDYSHGMKRKLGLIQALMTDAPVLILDEPTSGLDPLMIEAFGETIDELARSGRDHGVAVVARAVGSGSRLRADRADPQRAAGRGQHAERTARRATPRRLTVLFVAPVDGAACRCAPGAVARRRASRSDG